MRTFCNKWKVESVCYIEGRGQRGTRRRQLRTLVKVNQSQVGAGQEQGRGEGGGGGWYLRRRLRSAPLRRQRLQFPCGGGGGSAWRPEIFGANGGAISRGPNKPVHSADIFVNDRIDPADELRVVKLHHVKMCQRAKCRTRPRAGSGNTARYCVAISNR
jgi:hypothetical protein